MNKVSVIGLDLAKNVFQVHGVDSAGEVVVRKQLKRSQVRRFFTNLEPCLVGMEACGGAHYWTRELAGLRHTVRMMAPVFVKPYLKANKNDRTDAEAICEAVRRPSMRLVQPKTPEQQAVLHLHRARRLLVRQRVALSNHLRGILSEYGIDLPQGAKTLSGRLASIPGIGVLTASALVATVGEGQDFSNGRQLAAYLGLVPRQASSGGKVRLLGISKRGDGYLRGLLIQGARNVIYHIRRRLRAGQPGGNAWVEQLLQRAHPNAVAVALANKMARIAWVLLVRNKTWCPARTL